MNYKEAPPPVDMYVMSGPAFAPLTKFPVSPPPITERAPSLVLLTTFFNSSKLPV